MGRKVTFDEKRQIVWWTIEHNNNYKAAAEKYDISYQRVYSWVWKYRVNSDWEVLKDNRGRNKGKEPTNELERLRKRVRELEARDRKRELQIAFAKKLVEIRNREVKRPDDIKLFKKWTMLVVNWYEPSLVLREVCGRRYRQYLAEVISAFALFIGVVLFSLVVLMSGVIGISLWRSLVVIVISKAILLTIVYFVFRNSLGMELITSIFGRFFKRRTV